MQAPRPVGRPGPHFEGRVESELHPSGDLLTQNIPGAAFLAWLPSGSSAQLTSGTPPHPALPGNSSRSGMFSVHLIHSSSRPRGEAASFWSLLRQPRGKWSPTPHPTALFNSNWEGRRASDQCVPLVPDDPGSGAGMPPRPGEAVRVKSGVEGTSQSAVTGYTPTRLSLAGHAFCEAHRGPAWAHTGADSACGSWPSRPVTSGASVKSGARAGCRTERDAHEVVEIIHGAV